MLAEAAYGSKRHPHPQPESVLRRKAYTALYWAAKDGARQAGEMQYHAALQEHERVLAQRDQVAQTWGAEREDLLGQLEAWKAWAQSKEAEWDSQRRELMDWGERARERVRELMAENHALEVRVAQHEAAVASLERDHERALTKCRRECRDAYKETGIKIGVAREKKRAADAVLSERLAQRIQFEGGTTTAHS